MKILNVYGEVIYADSSRSQQEVLQNAVRNGICLDFADLQGWDLSGVYLVGASLKHSDMLQVSLRGAHIENSSFFGAYLRAADLRGEFDNVDFRFANIHVAELNGSALEHSYGIYQFGPIGETNRLGYAVDWGRKVMIKLGCFWGTRKEAIMKIREKYGDNSLYERQIKLAAEVVQRKRWIEKES